MATIIPFGKYKGRSLEQLALTNYPYLAYLRGEDSERYSLYGHFKEKFYEILHKLNNFIPLVNCENCKSTATNISTAYSLDRDYEILGSYFYCDHEECKDTIIPIRVKILPIKYDSILEYPGFPKYLRKEMQKLLLKTIGLEDKEILTKEKAEELINNLKLIEPFIKPPKKPEDKRQLSLF